MVRAIRAGDGEIHDRQGEPSDERRAIGGHRRAAYVFHLRLENRELLGEEWRDCLSDNTIEYDILLHHWEDCQTYLTPLKEKSLRMMLKTIYTEKIPITSISPMISELETRDMIRRSHDFWCITEVGYNSLVVDEEGISLSRDSITEWASGRVSPHPWFSGNLQRAMWTGHYDMNDTMRFVKEVKVTVNNIKDVKRGKRSRTVWCEVPVWRYSQYEECEEGDFPGPVVRDDSELQEEESIRWKRKKKECDFA